MKYPVAEKFFAPQGEGLYTGTPMAFIRFVGCSVGKRICTSCDTNFEKIDLSKGGGLFTVDELIHWAEGFKHVCLSGGEPLDRNLQPLIEAFASKNVKCHIETSGTKLPAWLYLVSHHIWLCVSPKPGFLPEMVTLHADEVKVIFEGLGKSKMGWPTLDQAILWSQNQLVYLQPRNLKEQVDPFELKKVLHIVMEHPTLRISVQLHKFLGTR